LRKNERGERKELVIERRLIERVREICRKERAVVLEKWGKYRINERVNRKSKNL